MLMKVQPLRDAINAAKQAAGGDVKVIYLSPQGKPLNQRGVNELAAREKLIFVAGRYEGIDERLIGTDIDEEWSIGDYVISGGELAAMVVIDAITRLQPGAVGDEDSVVEDSFMTGLLDCPHYTRPEQLDDQAVPDVLLSGHHEEIKRWRLKQSLGRTKEKRPDLLEKRQLNEQEKLLLAEYLREQDEKKAQ
jgi:tRNA (guanine37-N1)-methyltransferase